MLTRAALVATGAAALLKVIPAQYAIDAGAAMGVCAALAAAWRPTNPALQAIWAVVDGVGMNFGYAKNGAPPTA
jgi:hypothetical protein